MIWLKRLGYLLGGVLGLLLLAIFTVYAITSLRFRKRYEVAATPVPVASDSASLARGRHLALAIGKCTECHGQDLGGTIMGDDGAFGRLVASNLTAGNGGAAIRYDDAMLARAIRHGIRTDGTPLFFMPSEAFQAMSDEDVGKLIGYIRSLPPVDRVLPSSKAGPLARVLSLLGGFPLLPARLVDHSATPPRTMPEAATAEYGKYLTQVGGCTGCHGPGLSGGKMGPGKPASNLTPTGIGSWTEADFVRALREGLRPGGGGSIDSTAMPWPAAGKMTDAEIHAVWLYLRSVPPREFGNR